MIKGVVFDFNGTLFWDTHLHNKAWDAFLEKHSIQLSDRDKEDKIHGKHNPAILANLFDRPLSEKEIRDFSLEKELIYQEICNKEDLDLAMGAIDLFRFLKRQQIHFTIATASDKINVDYYFEKLELDRFFDKPRVVYNNGKLRSKPHPDFFSQAIKNLDCSPGDVMVFEDSFAGIEAAERAGAGHIIIVDSIGSDYSRWNYPIIKDFNDLDLSAFTE